jgi:hypothetical protein
MANSTIDIPFYVAKAGTALTSAAGEMNFQSLMTISGVDKSASAPAISETGGGWYKFSVAYGSEPFDNGDLVGVIDADKDGVNGLGDAERYIPVEVRLDYYALCRSVNVMSQDKLSGVMDIKDADENTILKLDITESQSSFTRRPGW